MDLTSLTDEELFDHLNEVIGEQERRARLAQMPAQICALAAQYVASGGDKATIIDALNEESE